ncbi:M14 family metallopeptidase [Psychrilyobacter atlanticus]|uniref:M14 family metallopeptidase n=1 Tax=Psychrilyobacter atlanticus TaxID=271091 RepID=UPI00040DD28C|nr:M14 family metallopeptidase [Psychrilyobacter atlanticus]
MHSNFFWIIITMIFFFCTSYTNDKQKTNKVIKYFSNDYTKARKKFIDTSLMAGASIKSLKNPNKGPNNEALYTDIALFGSKDAKNVLVLISGTHGVEGFAGSGIQTGLLQEGITSKLTHDTSILMIHALNPYGFAHIRRFDEDNVDPNRNFIDHSESLPKNTGYEYLSDSIAPNSISFFSNIKSFFKLLWYGVKNGQTKLKFAISGGQYSDPKGLFYGGRSKTWMNQTMGYISEKYLVQAERVVVLDIHTGLGHYGEYEIILNEKEETAAYKRAKKWWGDKVKTTFSNESVSIHLPGSFKLALPRMFPNAEVTAVSLEFGTISSMRVFWALRSENWLYHHGGRNHLKAEKIKSKLLRAFYPDDPKWKFKVWIQGQKIVEQTLMHIQ